MKYTPEGLSPEDRADLSAVIGAIHESIDDEQALLAVHRVLETVRARAVQRSRSGPGGSRPDARPK